MKAKKVASVVLVVMGLMAVMTVNSYAAASNYLCNVAQAGPIFDTISQTTRTVIILNYVSGAPVPTTQLKSFYVPVASDPKQFLAVALAALTTGQQVHAIVDFDGPGNVVFKLWLMP
jgi:hypothetical protein